MCSAQNKNNYRKIAIVLLLAALIFPKNIRAASGAPQICEPSTTCVIGEFLYDDSYTPITTSICTLTAYNPSGVLYLDGQALTPTTDGWYGHSFTTSATVGMYRAQICCVTSGEKMCLDKSFEVKAKASTASSTEIASAVWGYSSRTLSSFGTLAADVWANTTRTITGGTSSSTGTATDSANLASIKKTVQENRDLLEQIVNKPIITNILETDNTDLGEKISGTKSRLGQLFINSQYATSKAELLAGKWRMYSQAELSANLNEIQVSLKEDDVEYLAGAWDFPVLTTLKEEYRVIQSSVSAIQRSLDLYGSKTIPEKELKNLTAHVVNFEKLIGKSSDLGGEGTVYGKVKEVTELAALYDQRTEEVDKTLVGWNKLNSTQKLSAIETFSSKLASINLLPKIEILLSGGNTDRDLKNRVLSIRGILATNKLLLAKKSGAAFSNTWLEEGSVIFKTVVTNPSTYLRQDVPLKYYLPAEVKEEGVVEKSSGLTVAFDSEKNLYYVEGTFSLAPKETKTISVRVSDVWKITDEEVNSLRTQAETLSKPLEKTAYFAQGVTLKSDIDVSLDKVLALQEGAVTPEAKIRADREAKIEYDGAQEKIDKLKDLTTQAGSTNNLFGFVGGTQSLAMWGIVLIIVTGFVWLTITMKQIRAGSKEESSDGENNCTGIVFNHQPSPMNRLALPFLIIMILSVGGTIGVTKWFNVKNKEEVKGVAVEQKETASGGVDIVMVKINDGQLMNVYKEASASSEVIYHFDSTKEVVRLASAGEWDKIAFSKNETPEVITEGYINNQTVMDSSIKQLKADTKDTSTGLIKISDNPDGKEIGKVESGKTVDVLQTEEGWCQIKTADGRVGWVIGKYLTIK